MTPSERWRWLVACPALLCAALLHAEVPAAAPSVGTQSSPAEVAAPDVAPPAAEPQTAILEVIVNDRKAGQFFAQLLPDGDVRIESGFFAAAQIDSTRIPARGDDGYVSLRAMEAGLHFTVNPDAARLDLRVSPDWLPHRRISAKEEQEGELPSVPVEAASGFVNYGLQASHTETEDTWALPWDIGGHYRQYLLTSEFRYDPEEGSNLRLQSRLTRDWPERAQRLTVGDVSPRAFGTGGAGMLGGLAFEKIYEMRPDEKKNAGLGTTLTLDRPSTVEVLQDGRSLRKLQLDAGVVQLDDIIDSSGSGTVSIEITDISGDRRLIEVPYYITTSILKPGLHEYGYYLGQRREQLGVTSNDYDSQVSFVGGHRYGITPTLTVGGHGQAGGDTVNGGPLLNATIAGRAEIAILTAASRRDDQAGYGGRLDTITRLGDKLQAAASVEGFTREYATLSIAPADDKLRGSARANLSWSPNERLGTFSAGAALRNSWIAEETRTYSVGYRRKLWSGLHLTVSANLAEGDDDSVMAFLLYSPPRNRARLSSATLTNEQVVDGDSAQTLDVRSIFPRTRGGWYNGRLRHETEQDSAQLGGGAHTAFGTAMINATAADSGDAVNGSFFGGLVFTRGGVQPSRAVSDSFAVVNAGLKGIPVKSGNSGETQGLTDRKGRLVVSDLASYGKSSITIDASAIPITHALTGNASTLRVANEGRRWGALVNFDIRPFRAVEGTLVFVQHDGARKPVEHVGISVEGGAANIDSVSGDKGYFYLENLAPGRYTVKAMHGQTPCSVAFDVPDASDSLILGLGELVCAP